MLILANLFFLGSTDMLVILVVALIIFGPRKLPEISRTIGRSLAEFRRASDEFKMTWEREVEMERDTQQGRAILPDHSQGAPGAGAALGSAASETLPRQDTFTNSTDAGSLPAPDERSIARARQEDARTLAATSSAPPEPENKSV